MFVLFFRLWSLIIDWAAGRAAADLSLGRPSYDKLVLLVSQKVRQLCQKIELEPMACTYAAHPVPVGDGVHTAH